MRNRSTACLSIAPALAALAGLAGLAAACSSSAPPKPLVSVAAQTGADWVLDFHPAFRTLSSATPKRRTRSLTQGGVATDIEKTARQFFAENAEQFKIDLGNATVLPIVTDRKGGTHITFEQRVGSVPVRGGQVSLHLTTEGTVSYIQATWAPGAATLDTAATLDAAASVATAKADLKRRYPAFDDSWIDGSMTPSLAIEIDHSGTITLVYEMLFNLRTIGAEYRYLVDAKSGVLMRATDEVVSVAATGKGVLAYANDARKNGDDVKSFEVETLGESYVLYRSTSDGLPPLGVYDDRRNRNLVSSKNLSVWDETGIGAGSAVDAFVTMTKVDAFFASLGRRSFDNKGTLIRVVVHASQEGNSHICNASFFRNAKSMVFYDGDYAKPGPNSGCMPLSASLDVAAHEYAHAVISADLNLDTSPEAWALNESIADIFGALAERTETTDTAKNVQTSDDGFMGPGTTPLRDMRTPTNGRETGKLTPDNVVKINHSLTFKNPKGEIKRVDEEPHYLSNIPSHAFYLMTEGGTNATSGITVTGGIGWGAAQELYYDVVSTRKLDPKATFKSAAKATIAVAKSWTEGTVDFASAKPVICAWVAVGVLTEDEAKKDYDTVCRCPQPEAGTATTAENCCPEGATDTSCCSVCDTEGCTGKPDGFHCFKVAKSGGRTCEGGQLTSAQQCGTDQVCTGADSSGNITCDNGKGF
jgi:Zn-dependent metalloprotease